MPIIEKPKKIKVFIGYMMGDKITRDLEVFLVKYPMNLPVLMNDGEVVDVEVNTDNDVYSWAENEGYDHFEVREVDFP